LKNQKDSNQTTRKVKDKMTKKDYIKIAAMLKGTLQDIGKEESLTDETKAIARIEHSIITGKMADIFQDDNPLFDRRRFLTACGYTD